MLVLKVLVLITGYAIPVNGNEINLNRPIEASSNCSVQCTEVQITTLFKLKSLIFLPVEKCSNFTCGDSFCFSQYGNYIDVAYGGVCRNCTTSELFVRDMDIEPLRKPEVVDGADFGLDLVDPIYTAQNCTSVYFKNKKYVNWRNESTQIKFGFPVGSWNPAISTDSTKSGLLPAIPNRDPSGPVIVNIPPQQNGDESKNLPNQNDISNIPAANNINPIPQDLSKNNNPSASSTSSLGLTSSEAQSGTSDSSILHIGSDTVESMTTTITPETTTTVLGPSTSCTLHNHNYNIIEEQMSHSQNVVHSRFFWFVSLAVVIYSW
ncbi:hypothetical protein BC833DRAFT_592168 [Globomyces pollinis-pini]|nr:hypothetical protein BC833DRAFT_592168 [Globomyces pollinis-pini]